MQLTFGVNSAMRGQGQGGTASNVPAHATTNGKPGNYEDHDRRRQYQGNSGANSVYVGPLARGSATTTILRKQRRI
jgi:hypothetical protein